jgi:ribose transport system permease protein
MLQRVRIGTHHRTTQAKKDIAVSVVVPIVLVMLVIVFSLLKPASFFTIGNFQTVLTGQAVLLMVALCLTVVLAAGDLDLSIGGLIGFSGVMFGYLTAIHHFPWGIGLLVSVALGIIIGLINAMLIVGLGVNSLITTLAMGTLLNGVSSAVSKSETIGGLPYVMSSIVDKKFLGIGIAFWYSIIIGFILWYVLHHTRTGRYIYFTGEGREAAKLAGVRTNKIRVIALVVSAIGASLAGLLLVGQTGSAQAGVGDPYLLPAYAAVFLGAATIKVGRFNPIGTFLSVILLAIGTDGLQLFGLAAWVTDVFDAGILIVAVGFAAIAGTS